MTTSPTVYESALEDRLRSIAPSLLPGLFDDPAAQGGDAGSLLETLVDSVATDPDPAGMWALLTCVCGAYPTRDDMDRVRRRVELARPELRTLALLEAAHPLAALGDLTARVEVVTGGVLADVDFSAKNDLNSGIQRVCRSLLPLWAAQHGVIPMAWAEGDTALRTLDAVEEDRVLRWGSTPARPDAVSTPSPTLLVPWRSVVVMIETPGGEVAERLACIGERSGNALVGVVHDAIPVVSSDLVLPQVASKFVRYLTAVKFASRLAADSHSAAEEFSGFVQSLPVQGLTGPEVVTVPLGGESVPPATPAEDGEPKILVVGSHEPRKNHLTVLYSAEVLWREGLAFSVEFIGAGGWGEDFPRRVNELRLAGRSISVRTGVSEEELDEAYRTAAFTLFPSLHEGYGLPIVESFSRGTPVVTSDFGSMSEVAAGGGALTVDPRDTAQLTTLMRELLTDPERLAQLRAEIALRPDRDWQAYADELWEQLVRPELARLGGRATTSHPLAPVGGP